MTDGARVSSTFMVPATHRQSALFPNGQHLRRTFDGSLLQVTDPLAWCKSRPLISLLLTQLTENRHLAAVFEDLFNPTGAEIYLKPAPGYLLPGMPANFSTIAEAAGRHGETAIGYRIHAEFYQAPSYGVVLNPPEQTPLSLTDKDRVIVLAED